jgi:hypothetical protein
MRSARPQGVVQDRGVSQTRRLERVAGCGIIGDTRRGLHARLPQHEAGVRLQNAPPAAASPVLWKAKERADVAISTRMTLRRHS